MHWRVILWTALLGRVNTLIMRDAITQLDPERGLAVKGFVWDHREDGRRVTGLCSIPVNHEPGHWYLQVWDKHLKEKGNPEVRRTVSSKFVQLYLGINWSDFVLRVRKQKQLGVYTWASGKLKKQNGLVKKMIWLKKKSYIRRRNLVVSILPELV